MIDLSEKLARKQQSLDRLNAYSKFVSKASLYLNRLPEMDQVTANRLLSAVKVKLENMSVPHGYSKLHSALVNEVNGLSDGLGKVKASRLKAPVFARLSVKCKAHINQIKADINLLSQGQEFESDADRETLRILKQTSKQSSKIQKIKNRKWIVVRASVIPIPANAFLDMEKLKRSFDMDVLNGYAVIHSQICLGINKRFLGNRTNLKEYLSELVDYLSAQKGEKLILLRDKGMISELTGMNVNWYWLMTQHQAENFRHSFNTNGISIKDWGFANAS